MDGIAAFDALEKLIAGADVLHVCTPPSSHEALALQVLGQDKDLIIEKPLTEYFGADKVEFNDDTFSQ